MGWPSNSELDMWFAYFNLANLQDIDIMSLIRLECTVYSVTMSVDTGQP